MPLDSRKISHIQAVIPQTWAGRTKSVVFVYNSGGTYSYVAQSVIFRPQEVIDPEIPDLAGSAPTPRADMVMIAALSISFVGVVYIADTASVVQSAVAAAAKYEVIEATPTGIVPGGTHYKVDLRRLR